MRFHYPTSLLQVACLLLLCGSSVAEVYQWKNSAGDVHYGDRIPPENAKQGHSKLDKFGQTIKQVGAQKSVEQIRLEHALAAIEAEKARQRQAQSSKDRALIVTFSDVTQLDKLRDDRIRLLNAKIRIAKNKIKKIELQLENAENRKVQYVSQKRTPPKQLSVNIAEYEKQLVNHYNQISLNNQRKQKIIDKFATDRARFLELRARN